MAGTAWTEKTAGLKAAQTADLSLVTVNHCLPLGSNNTQEVLWWRGFLVARCVQFQGKNDSNWEPINLFASWLCNVIRVNMLRHASQMPWEMEAMPRVHTVNTCFSLWLTSDDFLFPHLCNSPQTQNIRLFTAWSCGKGYITHSPFSHRWPV